MKKRLRSYRFLSIFLALSLCLFPLTAACGAGNTPQISDHELVVTSLNSSGNIDQIQVLDHLKATGSGQVTISDSSKYKLESVRNLYSTDSIRLIGNNIKIAADLKGSKDIYYLGSLAKSEVSSVKFPIKLNIDYYLNGQKTTPANLSGKDGHLKIVVTLENTTGVDRTLEFTDSKGNQQTKDMTLYTPYVVSLSGWQFSNKIFSNVAAPGVSGQSPEGVVTDIKGTTSVSWTVPLIPPKYPAKQYTTLEADVKDLALETFDIAVIPVVPETSEVDTMKTFQNSFQQLYDGFDAIAKGVGNTEAKDTILNGFGTVLKAIGSQGDENTVISGLSQISGGLGSLFTNMIRVRMGLEMPGFDASTYNASTGKDANGRSPGLKDAVEMVESGLNTRILAGLDAQNTLVVGTNGVIGSQSDSGATPSASSSLFNDINTVRALSSGPAATIIDQAILPKLGVVSTNLTALQKGGTVITSQGPVQFPASIAAIKQGLILMAGSLDKTSAGIDEVKKGIGDVKSDGSAVPTLVNGQPGTALFALQSLKDGTDKIQTGLSSQLLPGLAKMEDGVGQIGQGAGTARESLSIGLVDLGSATAIKEGLKVNADSVDTFLGKPAASEGKVVFVFQTAPIKPHSSTANAMVTLVVLLGIICLGSQIRQRTAAA